MKTYIISILTFCLMTLSFALPAAAEKLEISPVTDTSGKLPVVARVELQHDTVRAWLGKTGKTKPLIVFSDILGMYRPSSEAEIEAAIRDAKAGNWDRALSKPYPTPEYAPINIGNYIYYLYRLGVISEVYWVPPVRGSVGNEPLDSFKEYLANLGASDVELAGLKQEAGYIRGTVNGVPIHVTGLGDLVPPISDSLMVIDINTINSLYRDEVTEPMLDLFAGFITALASARPLVSHAAVVNNTIFGDVPLERRFIGSYFERFLTDPEAISSSPPDTWLIRSEIMYKDTFFQVDESLELCKKAVEVAPDDPDARYELALGYFGTKDIDPMIENLIKAVELDRGYYLAYIKYAGYFSEKGFLGAALHLLDKADAAVPGDPRILEARHNILVENEDYAGAIQAQSGIISMGFDSSYNHSILADDYKKAGDFKNSISSYKKALSMIPVMGDQTRTGFLLGIAEAYEGAKMLDDAEKSYKDALASATDDNVKHGIKARYEKFVKDWAPFRGTKAN
jgi:tetratricopeptide (TPR) repeat protein